MSDNWVVTPGIVARVVTLLRRLEFWIFGDLSDPGAKRG